MTKEMKCGRVEAFLSRYQDNELDRETREIIDGHLLQCSSCSEELNRLRQVTSELKRLRETEVSPNFTARVMGKLKGKESPGWFGLAFPSFVYPVIFLIFLGLGLLVNIINLDNPYSPVKVAVEQTQPEIYTTMTRVLEESQDIRLISVQEQTMALLVNGNGNGNGNGGQYEK
jgi:hypothetical protein